MERIADEDKTKEFLDGLIVKESCLIERLFLQHKMDPEKPSSWIILKINASRFFQYPQVTCGDKKEWSGNIWYDYNLLGGWIYELRRKGVKNQKIYYEMISAEERFLAGEGGKYSLHKIYNTRIEGLKKLAEGI